MTAANFDRALALVLVSEGGYADNPNDPGGPTNMGITQATLSGWLGHPATVDDVKSLTKALAAAIYKVKYWNAVNGDDLPSGLDYAVFDFAVNSGPKRAIEVLQSIIGVKQDGIMGPATIDATHVDPSTQKADIVELCDARLAWLKTLGTWSAFGAGWSARVARVKVDALRMAAPDTNPPPPISVTVAPPNPKGTIMQPPTAISLTQLSGWATMLVSAISGVAGVIGMFSPTTALVLTAIVGALNGFAHAITPGK